MAEAQALQEYKCPSCGGSIEFDSKIQKMKCPYCDSEFDMQLLKELDDDLQNPTVDDMEWQTQAGSDWQEGETDGMNVYVCESCGGEIVGDATTAATACPYCDNSIVIKGQFRGDLKPDVVIPFKLDKKAAVEGLKKHLMGKRLLPKVFKDQNHIDEVKGIYVPFWLFDADAKVRAQYRATRVRHWSDNNYNYKETSYFICRRAGDISFDRVPVDGSSKMPDDLMESIEPFDQKDVVDFQTAYLSGYLADRYDVSADESVDRANQRIKTSSQLAFAATVNGYTTVVPEFSNVQLQNGKTKYALYPVWLLNTTWNGQKYTFAMNGQTGKFVGNLPCDKGAYWRWWGTLAGITAAGIMGLSLLIHFI